VTSTYTYGADGLRRTSTVNGKTTYYVYDGQTLIREMQQNAQGVLQSTATYLCGPRGPEYRRDDTQAEGTYTDASGTHPAGKTRWYVYDGLGSVVGEVDPSGNITSSPKYDVYGLVRTNSGTASTAHGFVGALGHTSDASTGLIYMRARYYDPSVGRFVSEDPKGQGLNWFAYCANDPVNLTDNTGLDPFEPVSLVGFTALILWAVTKALGSLGIIGPEAKQFLEGIDNIISGMALAALSSEVFAGVGQIADKAGAYHEAWGMAGTLAATAIMAIGCSQILCLAIMGQADEYPWS